MALDQTPFIDLRELQSRLASHQHNNSVFTFEQGQVVKRSYADVHNDVAAARAKFNANNENAESGEVAVIRYGVLRADSTTGGQ